MISAIFVFTTVLMTAHIALGFKTHHLVPRLSSSSIFSNGKDNQKKDSKKFSFGGLIQLITMGAGAPSLGEYKRTDENGRMIFELEANNFADADGNPNQLKAKYFMDGYVAEDENKPPGFWGNLLSGGRLQREWEDKLKK